MVEEERFGLHPGGLWASLAIAVEPIGPVLLISGRLVWPASRGLGVLTFIASLAADNFWAMQGHGPFIAIAKILIIGATPCARSKS